jgi:uncharacterized LabA/DUF88 family protein
MDKTYAYIDGAFLRDRSAVAIEGMFGCKPELDFNHIRSLLGANRLFYYDCIEDGPRDGETQEGFERRTQAQNSFVESATRSNLCHVKLGTLRERQKGKRITQKEVDVKIAVDMLTDAHNKSIERAVLMTGDLDFRPVVERLVQLGVIVELRYDPKVTAEELIAAADIRQPITIQDWWVLLTSSSRAAHPLPSRSIGQSQRFASVVLQTGHVGKYPATLLKSGDTYVVELSNYDPNGILRIDHRDREFLLTRYLPREVGEVMLNDDALSKS